MQFLPGGTTQDTQGAGGSRTRGRLGFAYVNGASLCLKAGAKERHGTPKPLCTRPHGLRWAPLPLRLKTPLKILIPAFGWRTWSFNEVKKTNKHNCSWLFSKWQSQILKSNHIDFKAHVWIGKKESEFYRKNRTPELSQKADVMEEGAWGPTIGWRERQLTSIFCSVRFIHGPKAIIKGKYLNERTKY